MAGENRRSEDTDRSEPVFTCSEDSCEETARESALIRGSFCTLDCFHRSKGRAILRKIRYDHRFCSSCFRVRKEIDYPPESFIQERTKLTAKSMIGEEELTPHMRKDAGLIYCSCGTVDHDAADETLREIEGPDSVENLWALLHQLEAESNVAAIPSKRPFREALDRSDGDLALAVGAAIYE